MDEQSSQDEQSRALTSVGSSIVTLSNLIVIGRIGSSGEAATKHETT